MDTPNNKCTVVSSTHRGPCLLASRRRLCLHRIRVGRHHFHFLFIHLRLLCLFAGHYCSDVLDPPCTYAKVLCCESCDSVLVHRACCQSLKESQPHLTLYNIQQHSTKTQNRIWVIIFESYLARLAYPYEISE